MRPAATVPQVYLCVKPVDFRKSITGLSLIVEQSLQLNPFEAALFVFISTPGFLGRAGCYNRITSLSVKLIFRRTLWPADIPAGCDGSESRRQ